MKRVDADGKRIIHDRAYIYESRDPLLNPVVGRIRWDRQILHYIFTPSYVTMRKIIVQFDLQNGNLVAKEYKRAKK